MTELARINEMFLRTGCQQATIAELTAPPPPEIHIPEEIMTLHRIYRSSDWRKYKALAWKLTRQQPLHLLPNFEKRAFKGWHLDHVLSIKEAYNLNLPAETVAHISNLRMIPARDNLDKGTKRVYTNLLNE